MSQEVAGADLWFAVDEFFQQRLSPTDEILDEILRRSAAAGLPEIAVSPSQGKLLQLLVTMLRAERVLEIGTLAGYSAVWMARAFPATGRMVTLEFDGKHADVAQANFELAGLADKIEIRRGPALQTLPQLAAEDPPPFDLVFVDADKVNTPAYFDWGVKLARPGGLVLVDNVVREGAILDHASTDPSVGGVRLLTENLAKDSRVSATVLQTVGVKGHDGIILAVVR